ncbi:MAG: lipid A export permease/ATP-binding protein MsbA [Selenomonadaceae bacterium]|nr:lipid A export permease/ATP-binding protein MsbA [Selenomonadaceae bacterium]
MSNYKRLIWYIKPYIKRLCIAVVCMVVAAGCNLYVPWIIKDMIDKVLMEKDMELLNLICVGIIVVFLIRGIFYYAQNYLISFVGQRVIIDVRQQLFEKFQRTSVSYYDKNQTGAIMSYVTNDVGAMQAAVIDNMVEMVTEGSILIGSVAMMFYLDWKLTLLTFIIVPLVGYAMNIFGRKMKSSGTLIQERISDVTSILQETLSAARVIKSFVREDFEIKRFDKANYLSFRANMKNVQVASMLTPVVETTAAMAVACILWVGGYEVVNGVMTAGALVAFLTYAINLANPVKRLSRVYGNIQKAMASADRVFEVLDMDEGLYDKDDAVKMPPIKGQIKLDNVTFGYIEGENALENISLEVKPGQMVALVGPSGSGKSTIANLVPRFYDVNSGSVTIDGIDIRDVTMASLREQVGLVPQETMLFSNTVMENIRYGRLEATDDEVIAAARAANADDFINGLPDKYQTRLGERGANLSGGQRQRIAIARAILKDPQILILDEATSALDTESEKIVQEALDKLMIGRTSIVIAHRLSTILKADQIFVVEAGHLREQGTHEELLAKKGLYKTLYDIQFDKSAES